VLSALTLVSAEARAAMPWLYESVVYTPSPWAWMNNPKEWFERINNQWSANVLSKLTCQMHVKLHVKLH
jgi:hypothetical protein